MNKLTSIITATNNQDDSDMSGAYDLIIGDMLIKAQLLITARVLKTSNATYYRNKIFISPKFFKFHFRKFKKITSTILLHTDFC